MKILIFTLLILLSGCSSNISDDIEEQIDRIENETVSKVKSNTCIKVGSNNKKFKLCGKG